MRLATLFCVGLLFVPSAARTQAGPPVTRPNAPPAGPRVHVDADATEHPFAVLPEEERAPTTKSAAHLKLRLVEWSPRAASLFLQQAKESDVDFAKRYAAAQQTSWEHALLSFRKLRADLAREPKEQREYETEQVQGWLEGYQADADRLGLEVEYWKSEMESRPGSLVAPTAYRSHVNSLNTVKSFIRVLERRLAQLSR
jgi:hypothetical protein